MASVAIRDTSRLRRLTPVIRVSDAIGGRFREICENFLVSHLCRAARHPQTENSKRMNEGVPARAA